MLHIVAVDYTLPRVKVFPYTALLALDDVLSLTAIPAVITFLHEAVTLLAWYGKPLDVQSGRERKAANE